LDGRNNHASRLRPRARCFLASVLVAHATVVGGGPLRYCRCCIPQLKATPVNAITETSGTIERLSEISSAIAAAVERQGAATEEISRNVQQAAQGTQQVSSNITDVQGCLASRHGCRFLRRQPSPQARCHGSEGRHRCRRWLFCTGSGKSAQMNWPFGPLIPALWRDRGMRGL